MNIPVAHTMGGEISGTIDESVRHAVTKLSHVHFPANQQAADRIIRMGEDPRRFTWWVARESIWSRRSSRRTGRWSTDWLGARAPARTSARRALSPGDAASRDDRAGQGEAQINETLAALQELRMPTIMLWPNADAGSEDTARGMRKFRERHRPDYIRFYKNFPIETWVRLMLASACVVGNSSAPIREGAHRCAGGQHRHAAARPRSRRQRRRRRTRSPRHRRGRARAGAHGRYPSDHLYGDGLAGGRIASVLAEAPLTVQKRLMY